MNRLLLYARLLFILLLCLPGLISCVSDDDECDSPVITEDDGFEIRFQIVTTGRGTRAADIEGDEVGTGTENYLNVDNIKYYLFDSNRKYLSEILPTTKTLALNENFTLYEVSAKVDDPYFLDNLDGILDFYILSMANTSRWRTPSFPTMKVGDSLEDFFTDGTILTVLQNSSTLLQPVTNATASRFPMAGLQRFTIPGSALLPGDSGNPYDLTWATGKSLNMLRSLAKIELIDKINITDGAIFNDEDANAAYRIKLGYFNGLMNSGTLLPAYSQWNRNNTLETQQVIAPTIPATAEYILPPVLNSDNTIGSTEGFGDNYRIQFVKDEAATRLREDKCPVYSCYVFEYLRPTGLNLAQQPYFTVETEERKGEDGTIVIESMTFPVRMATYTNGVATEATTLTQLRRNTIYRFEITAIGQDLTVNWTVCEMDKDQTEIEFN